MKDLPEYPTELDIYLNSLLDLLKTKYYNVSVNRGSDEYTFYFCLVKNSFKWPICFTTIPTTELLTYFELKQTPQQIKELLK